MVAGVFTATCAIGFCYHSGLDFAKEVKHNEHRGVMMNGRHKCNKSKRHPTYDKKWSGVSYAPHADLWHKKCGEQIYDEDETLYCPRCDDFVSTENCHDVYL
jgi:hypothetical protein